MADRVAFRTGSFRAVAVDRELGVIRDISVITAGQTKRDGLGNDPMLVDAVTLQQVADAINASGNGVKARMTHPELSGQDDIAYRIGYITNARVLGDKVLADFHAYDAADTAARRIFSIAEHDPASAGLSIISTSIRLEGNTLRINSLDAVDFVGAPAANPAGMLSAHKETAMTYTPEQMEYLKGLGLPDGATPEQIAEFVDDLNGEQKAAMGDYMKKPEEEAAASTPAPAPTPAPTPVPAPAAAAASATPAPVTAALSADEAKRIADEAVKADRERIRQIRAIALKCGFDAAWADKHIDSDASLDQVRATALDSLKREPKDMTTTHISVGSDLNRDTLGDAVRDAIMLRAGVRDFCELDSDGKIMLSADRRPVTRKAHDRANDFRGHSLLEIGRRFLLALGYREADRLGKPQLAELLMSRSRLGSALPGVYFAHTTSDFPFLLADAMGKQLRQAYALAPDTWSLWCSRNTAPDFKDIKKLQLSEAADLSLQPEGDDVTYGTLTESRETYALSTYSTGLKVTRQMLINDDLSAFNRVPTMLGRAAARKVESLAIAVLTANATLADSIALFASGHANITTGALSVASLGTARSLMRRQTALGSSDPLELTPRYLLVPETIATTAEQLIASTVDPAKQNAANNPFANRLQVIPSARLDTNSTTQWYLAADPSEIDTVEVSFLEGEESPVVSEEDEFDSDTRKVKVRHNVAAKAIDYRGLVRSTGA